MHCLLGSASCGTRAVIAAGGRLAHSFSGSGWDAARMIVSLLYRATRALLSVPTVLLRRDTTEDA
ncbi:hypothetical protein ACFFG9_00475, partial [Kutzneria buriramensis]|uniref:hypothetical protein n=1 Tax=Kutzneria buriramensis TaxID=1045776 RepID=UPI0035E74E57